MYNNNEIKLRLSYVGLFSSLSPWPLSMAAAQDADGSVSLFFQLPITDDIPLMTYDCSYLFLINNLGLLGQKSKPI